MQTNKKIGIIALGWLGESLAESLKTDENQIWGTVTSTEKARRIQRKGISTILWQSDGNFSEEVKSNLSDTDILILNLPPSVFKNVTYAEGLSSFLLYLNKNGKVIFTSSTGVYPNHLEDATEDYAFQQEDSNTILEAERSLQQQLKDRLCILRLAGLIGEDRNPVHYLAKKEVNDNPDKKVNLIHRKDIIQVITKVIEGNHFGEIFNVCHPDHPTRKVYYSKVAQDFNLPKLQFNQSTGNPENKIVNCTKLKKVLNYTDFVKL